MTARDWQTLHADYRTVINGIRHGLTLDRATGATVLEPVEDELTAPCPECGSPMQVVTDAIVSEEYHPGYHMAGTPLPRRERPAVVAACTGCECCVEIR